MQEDAVSPHRAGSIDLAPFKELLLRSCGHSFEKGREQPLLKALGRRMAALKLEDCETYRQRLRDDQTELLHLTELLTINETYFFREPEHLNLIVDKLLPEFLTTRNPGPIRILSAGCSTGEEPYSIAMLLRERFGPRCEQLFAITGVDIDSTVIASAKSGSYGKLSFRGMDPSLQERYFEPRPLGKFQLRETIRKQVDFEVVNLLNETYPPKMLKPDIILYRNVSIYFPEPVQQAIFGKLAELLAEDGCLLVGVSETMHHDLGILPLIKQDALFFYRKTPRIAITERRIARLPAAPPEPGPGGARQNAPPSPARAEAPRNRALTGPGQPPGKPAHAPLRVVRERFDAAIELAHRHQYDQALSLLEAILEQDQSFEMAHSLKGSLLLILSRFDEAQQICTAILKRNPLCLDAYLMLGMIARQQGNDQDAGQRFREALYLDASCWLAHFYTAELLLAQPDRHRARRSYETTLGILEKGSLQKHGQDFFPLTFDAEQFMLICRHKLSLLKENG